MTKKIRVESAVVTVVTALILVAAMFPLFWMFSSSFKSQAEIIASDFFPATLVFENYSIILRRARVISWLWNSVIVASSTTVAAILVSLFAGYSLGRLRFPGRNLFYMIVLSGFMFPIHSIMIPLFLMLRNFGLINTHAGIIFPLIVHPVSVLVITQFLRAIDNEFEDAARIDGANEMRILFQIMVPMALPAIATVSIFVFTYSWNEFLWPLLIAQSDRMYTLPVGLATLASSDVNVRFGPIMAANVIATLPVMIVYMLFQKRIVSGVALETR